MSALCSYCRTADADEMDHIIPKCQGGTNRPHNLTPSCKSCNCSKGTKTPEEWLLSILDRFSPMKRRSIGDITDLETARVLGASAFIEGRTS